MTSDVEASGVEVTTAQREDSDDRARRQHHDLAQVDGCGLGGEDDRTSAPETTTQPSNTAAAAADDPHEGGDSEAEQDGAHTASVAMNAPTTTHVSVQQSNPFGKKEARKPVVKNGNKAVTASEEHGESHHFKRPQSNNRKRKIVEAARAGEDSDTEVDERASNHSTDSRTRRQQRDKKDSDAVNAHISDASTRKAIAALTESHLPTTPSAIHSNIPSEYLGSMAFASPKDFFVPVPNSTDGQMLCTFCCVSMGYRVYTLKRHLYRHHPEVFRVEGSRKRSKSKDAADSDQISLHFGNEGSTPKSHKRRGSGVQDEEEERILQANDAFVEWLRKDVFPIKCLESRHFRDVLVELNPKYKLPSTVTIPRIASHSNGLQEARTMKGFVIQGDGQPPKLVTMEKPEPKLNEALVKVLRAGICGTDLAMINNYKAGFKGVLGHEFVGLVERVGDPRDPEAVKWIGKRVVGEINIACRQQTCNVCARPVDNERYTEDHVSAMKRSHCPNRVVVGILGHHGAFAEYLTLPLENLSVVPDAVFESHVAFVEPLAAACRIVEQKVIQPTDDVAVLGDGKLGLLIAEALRATKAASKLVVIGKHREKLALVRNVASECHEVSPHLHRTMRDRFDVCVESTGSPAGIAFALDIVKPGGVLVIKSTCASKKSPVNLELMQNKGIRLVGSRCGPFDVALKLLAEKKVDVQKYIEGVYPLERAEHALEHAKTRGTLKIQLVM